MSRSWIVMLLEPDLLRPGDGLHRHRDRSDHLDRHRHLDGPVNLIVDHDLDRDAVPALADGARSSLDPEVELPARYHLIRRGIAASTETVPVQELVARTCFRTASTRSDSHRRPLTFGPPRSPAGRAVRCSRGGYRRVSSR